MRILFPLIFVLAVIAGCEVVTARYYLPTDSRYVREGTICGFAPWGLAQVPLGESLTMAVRLRPVDEHIALDIQLALSVGTRVRFVNPEIHLEVPATGKRHSARLSDFRLNVFGRKGVPGHFEYVRATDLLEGQGRSAEVAGPDTQYAKKDMFQAEANFATEPVEMLVLKFPRIEVNDAPLDAQTIPVRLVERTGVASCKAD